MWLCIAMYCYVLQTMHYDPLHEVYYNPLPFEKVIPILPLVPRYMIKFVVSRPVPKITRPTYRGDPDTRFKNQKKRRFPIKNVWIVFGVFVLVYGSFLLLKNTLFAAEYTITTVKYNSGDVAKYGDPYLYKIISSSIKKENFNIARFSKNAILANVHVQYPFIQDLTISFVGDNVAKVDMLFQEPDMIIRNYDRKFGVIDGQLFPIYS